MLLEFERLSVVRFKNKKGEVDPERWVEKSSDKDGNLYLGTVSSRLDLSKPGKFYMYDSWFKYCLEEGMIKLVGRVDERLKSATC